MNSSSLTQSLSNFSFPKVYLRPQLPSLAPVITLELCILTGILILIPVAVIVFPRYKCTARPLNNRRQDESCYRIDADGFERDMDKPIFLYQRIDETYDDNSVKTQLEQMGIYEDLDEIGQILLSPEVWAASVAARSARSQRHCENEAQGEWRRMEAGDVEMGAFW